MNISGVDLPQEVLGYIFSFLPPQDLGRASRVCKAWNAVSKLDWIWQSFAVSTMALSVPVKGLWKDQCQIIQNWRTGSFQERSFLISLNKASEYGCTYRLLEDGTVFEIMTPDFSNPMQLLVRNPLDERELCRIDLAAVGCDRVFWEEIYKETWTIFDVNGKFFQFDIRTGKCINQFVGGAVTTVTRPILHCNDHEIITGVENKVQVWALKTGELSKAFEIEKGFQILGIDSTPNFILCYAFSRDLKCLFAISKKDWTTQARIEIEEGWDCSLHWRNQSLRSGGGNFCVLLDPKTMSLHIYGETFDKRFQLLIAFCIPSFSGFELPYFQIYKNWVCIYQDKMLRIFDVRNGKEVCVLKKDFGRGIMVQLNFHSLLVAQHSFEVRGRRRTLPASLYDFSKKISVLPKNSSWCSVM